MAKGLFAVYRDDPAPAGPSGTLARSAAAPPNKASARRKDGATRSEGGLRVSRLGDKENVDPLGGVRAGGQAALVGKAGKKPALGAKRGDDEGRCGAAAGAKKAPRAVAGQRGLSSGGPTNAVCTGTLRTRVLPDLPPLEPEEDVVAAPAASCAAPAIADVVLDDEPDLSSRTSCDTNPLSASTCSSARDSGYARSLRGTGSETDLDVDTAAAFADEDASVEVEVSDGREADRRARALTESPLAEITQAFTGLGGFSAANMASPTPSHVRPTSSRPAPPTRTRSSPSKIPSLSALPTRMAPYAYSTTATTKRAKPAQAGGDKPRTGPLRF